MNYNIVGGIEVSKLNKIISETYTSVYPNLFKNTIDIEKFGIKSIEFDINIAPTINFDMSSDIKKFYGDILKSDKEMTTSNLSSKDYSNYFELASAVSFGINTSLELIINYPKDGPTKVKAELNSILTIQTNIGDKKFLTIQCVSANITSNPSNPEMDSLFNRFFIPNFIKYLNKEILSPIKIPTLEFESLSVSFPVPFIQPPYFLIYSALMSVQDDTLTSSEWPQNCFFIGMDTSVLKAASVIPFPIGPSSKFNKGFISGEVGAQIKPPSNIQINNDGSLSASIDIEVLAQLKIKSGPLHFHLGPRADASLAVTFKPSVTDRRVYLVMEGVPIPTFYFEWGSVPQILKKILKKISIILNKILNPLIGKALKFPPIKVYTLPEISFKFADQTFNINLGKVTTSSKNSLLMLEAQVNLDKKSKDKESVPYLDDIPTSKQTHQQIKSR